MASLFRKVAHVQSYLCHLLYEFFVYCPLKKILRHCYLLHRSFTWSKSAKTCVAWIVNYVASRNAIREKERLREKTRGEKKRETDRSREATRKCFTWRTWPCEAAIAVKPIYGRTCESSAGATGRIMTLRGSTGASVWHSRVVYARSHVRLRLRDTSRSRASCRVGDTLRSASRECIRKNRRGSRG